MQTATNAWDDVDDDATARLYIPRWPTGQKNKKTEENIFMSPSNLPLFTFKKSS